MKTSRRLGRGLEALVPLAPAGADGRARIDEVLRGGPAASVLSLSGRSVDDFFRQQIQSAPPPRPLLGDAPPAPAQQPAPAQAAPPQQPQAQVQARQPEPPTPAPPPAPARAAQPKTPPAPALPIADAAPAPAVQFDLFDPPIGDFILIDDDIASEAETQAVVRAPVAAPTRPAAPPPPPAPAPRQVAAAPAPPPPAPPPARQAPAPAPAPPAPSNDSVFLDDEVGGIVLPDIDLE